VKAFDEIARRGDAAGVETIALLRRLGAQETRSSSFPPPEGYASWSDEAVDDLLGDMFAKNETRGRVFVLGCFAIATDQASLERLILASIRNFLIDQAKGTETGKLRRRLAALLKDDGRFLRPLIAKTIPAWALMGRATELWQGDVEQLHEAASRVRGHQILSWNVAGKTPLKNAVALTTVSYAVIHEAAGAVRDQDIAQVVARRFILIAPPVFVELPDGRFNDSGPPVYEGYEEGNLGEHSIPANTDAGYETYDQARWIWPELSTQERALLPKLGASLAARVEATGLGRAATQTLTESLVERLRLATSDDDDRETVVLLLVQMCGGAK
jgi:hypothetical protein